MIELNICPRCGEHNRSRSSSWGFCPCWTCGFKLTEREAEKIHKDEDRISEKTKRRILKKRLMEKMVVDKNGN
jgi:tRNA(Ile2) C34 agmatinyltransferase TiaS